MTLAIAHKDYDVRGGGEFLVETLAEGLDAPLYAGDFTREHVPLDLEVPVQEIAPDSRWHRLANRGGLARAVAHMMLWRDRAPEELGGYDTIVTSGNEPQWYTPPDGQTWVAYTHTTPRWQYDLYHDVDGWLARTATQLKRWVFEQELQGPDLWVANSDIVAQRMERYWDLPRADIRVVYPPVETAQLGPDHARTRDYYLMLGRLAEVKAIREVVAVANERDLPLKVAGDGPLRAEIETLAGPTVEVVGWVDGQRKRELLAGAKALINNSRNEDFGIVPIEAVASGTPVLTVNEGMPQHTVLDPECGLTFERGELSQAIDRLERDGIVWGPEEMAAWTDEQFSTERFIDEMEAVIAEAQDRTAIDPALPRRPPATVAADGGESDA